MSITTVFVGLAMLGTAYAAEPEPSGTALPTTTTLAPERESSRGHRGDPGSLPTGLPGFGAPGSRPPDDDASPRPITPPPAH